MTDNITIKGQRILRLPEVIHRTGYKRASIYKFISQGKFPPSCKIGPRAVGWNAHEIDKWVEERLSGNVPPNSDDHQAE